MIIGTEAAEDGCKEHRHNLGDAKQHASADAPRKSLGSLSVDQLGQLLAVYDDIGNIADEFPAIIKSKRVGGLLRKV